MHPRDFVSVLNRYCRDKFSYGLLNNAVTMTNDLRRWMQISESLLSEGRDAPLYHTMDYKKAEAVFLDDTMEARWGHRIPGYGKVMGNSFTRNKLLRWRDHIMLDIDQSKLAQTHKIIPLDGHMIYTAGHLSPSEFGKVRAPIDRLGSQPLSEEFVVGDIKNLHRYITSITLLEYRSYAGDVSYVYQFTSAYAKKWNIPLNHAPRAKNIDR